MTATAARPRVRLRDALRTVPRMDAADWAAAAPITRWAVAARASVLLMTLCSALAGGLLAVREPGFDAALWALACLGVLLAHASNNLINDLVDFGRGLDAGDYHRARYGTHVLARGLISRDRMLVYIGVTAALAGACGAVLLTQRGALIAPLFAAGAFFVLFYTWPLKQLGLGEPAVLLVWGPLLTGGCHYAACGTWSWPAALIGTAYALGPTTVLLGKHLDKFPADAARAVRTLPVIIGEARTRRLLQLGALAPAPLIAALVASSLAPWPLLLTLAVLPAAWRASRRFAQPPPTERPVDYPAELWPLWYAHHAFALNRTFAGLMLAGLALGVVMG